MSVRRRKERDPKTGAVYEVWTVDVVFQYPDGQRTRVKRKSPVQTRRGAESYEREIRNALLAGTFGRKEVGRVPTLGEFAERFVDEWCRANKQKPSGIDSKQSVLRNHLLPLFGKRRLDSFEPADEDRLKRHLVRRSASTYNNAASVLNVALQAAKRWRLIARVPHRFQLLKRNKGRPKFYDFEQFEWLVEAAGKLDLRIHLVVLLGGDAGFRRGEILALEWPDVDLKRKQLTVERSEWKGEVTPTKGMRYRVVPMTGRLRDVLADHRHLRGERVLYTDAGKTVTAKVLQRWMAAAQKLAGVRATGGLHVLRHTFCSHLAMRGASAISIQELAGHEDLATTLGYMHLAHGERDRAIELLDKHRHVPMTDRSVVVKKK